jgi:hypothetical protein
MTDPAPCRARGERPRLDRPDRIVSASNSASVTQMGAGTVEVMACGSPSMAWCARAAMTPPEEEQ